MMARNSNVPFKGRIQKRKTHDLQIITFGLQRAAGPYRWATSRKRPALGNRVSKGLAMRDHPVDLAGNRSRSQSKTAA